MNRKTEGRKTIWIDELDISQMSCGYAIPVARKSVLERPLTLRGKIFERGVGTHAESSFTVKLNGRARSFEAMVGVDDDTRGEGTAQFEVWVDGKLAAQSGVVNARDQAKIISANLEGADELKLVVRDDTNEGHYSHADWADARIELVYSVMECPFEVVPLEPEILPEGIIVKKTSRAPSLNFPRIAGTTPGHEFIYRIPITGKRPFTITTGPLPSGLSIDSKNGVIHGSLKKDGEYKIQVTVRNDDGECGGTIVITGGKKKLVPTPPMGWNSWNVWGVEVDDAKVRAAAEMLVKTGLADQGYQYVNIDDGWEAGRADDGTILTNEKFPDMKSLSEYIHSLGLKFGIYSSPGPKTCGGYTGSYGHEEQDALTYAQWGVDYLKYDWCSYETIAKDKSIEELQKPYRVMAEALEKCGRDIVYSLCQYGMGKVWEWGADVGGNLWRTTGDIGDSWRSVRNIGFRQYEKEKFAGPGHWNDPDMLVLGYVGWGPNLHPAYLKGNEQLTHMSLWCLLAAPLLIGCDLTKLDDWTLSLLSNTEAIGVDQDPLGRQAVRICQDDLTEVWARPLADGSTAAGLFNRGATPEKISISMKELDLKGKKKIRDLWTHKDLGVFESSFSADVSPHGVAFIKIT
jgi:alpha-galactosidase